VELRQLVQEPSINERWFYTELYEKRFSVYRTEARKFLLRGLEGGAHTYMYLAASRRSDLLKKASPRNQRLPETAQPAVFR